MEAMFNLLKVFEEVADRPDAQRLKPGSGEIVFQDIVNSKHSHIKIEGK